MFQAGQRLRVKKGEGLPGLEEGSIFTPVRSDAKYVFDKISRGWFHSRFEVAPEEKEAAPFFPGQKLRVKDNGGGLSHHGIKVGDIVTVERWNEEYKLVVLKGVDSGGYFPDRFEAAPGLRVKDNYIEGGAATVVVPEPTFKSGQKLEVVDDSGCWGLLSKGQVIEALSDSYPGIGGTEIVQVKGAKGDVYKFYTKRFVPAKEKPKEPLWLYFVVDKNGDSFITEDPFDAGPGDAITSYARGGTILKK